MANSANAVPAVKTATTKATLKVTAKTKIIMAVHWGGYPLDLDRLKEIQEKAKKLYGFKPAIIEDGAHSFGTEYKGKKLGNHGNIVMYSLHYVRYN